MNGGVSAGLSKIGGSLGVEDRDIREIRRLSRRRNLRVLLAGGIGALASGTIGFFVGENYQRTGYSSYPYAAAMIMASFPIRPGEHRSLIKSSDRKQSRYALLSIALLAILALTFLAGYVVGNSDEPVHVVSPKYAVASRNRFQTGDA